MSGTGSWLPQLGLVGQTDLPDYSQKQYQDQLALSGGTSRALGSLGLRAVLLGERSKDQSLELLRCLEIEIQDTRKV